MNFEPGCERHETDAKIEMDNSTSLRGNEVLTDHAEAIKYESMSDLIDKIDRDWRDAIGNDKEANRLSDASVAYYKRKLHEIEME